MIILKYLPEHQHAAIWCFYCNVFRWILNSLLLNSVNAVLTCLFLSFLNMNFIVILLPWADLQDQDWSQSIEIDQKQLWESWSSFSPLFIAFWLWVALLPVTHQSNVSLLNQFYVMKNIHAISLGCVFCEQSRGCINIFHF